MGAHNRAQILTHALAVVLGCSFGVTAALAQQSPDRSRAPVPEARASAAQDSRATRREGGIPRRLGAESERQGNPQEGSEEGAPSADMRPRIKEVQPRFAPPQDDWRLGVWAANTDTGVIVTRVNPRSAAARAGLEKGDRIVAIGGYQVGYVGDYLYPLGYELQRHADARGHVELLVQNVRNNQLQNVPVQLDAGRKRPSFPVRP